MRLVVCADLTPLGGAEGASVVEELAFLASLSQQVLGEELLAPCSAPDPENGGMCPVRSAASGLIRLHRPDAVLFDGLVPILSLSGHTERYLATMASEDVVQQFPAFRIPLVAAFDWQLMQTEVKESIAIPAEPSQCIGLAD